MLKLLILLAMDRENKAKMLSVSVSMDPAILKIIDEARGLVKRSTYIDYLLKKGLLTVMKKKEAEISE